MILISHRGNTEGKNPRRENNPEYIGEALARGYHVEIDVWYRGAGFYLGHDKPTYVIEECFLENDKLWCHAKNLLALEKMLKNKKIHCFWHQDDDFAMTSRNIIWTYPGKELSTGSICVLPESHGIMGSSGLLPCLGICSDFISRFK